MKRSLITLVLAVVVLGASAFAQNTQSVAAPGGKGRFGRHGGEFSGLNLTADQRAQIKSIHQEQRTKMENLNKQTLTHSDFRNQAMQIRKEARDKIVNNVLTNEQRAQVQQRQNNRGGHNRRGGPANL